MESKGKIFYLKLLKTVRDILHIFSLRLCCDKAKLVFEVCEGQSVKLSFSIAQLGSPISNALFFRSGSSK